MATKMIDVDQPCIDDGCPGLGSSCAIALALRRAGFDVRRVDGYGVVLNDESPTYRHLPKKARVFMNRYDTRRTVRPFRFRFNPNRPSERY